MPISRLTLRPLAGLALITVLTVSSLAIPRSASAFGISLLAGAVHLPTTSFHALGGGLQLGFGAAEGKRFTLDLGMSVPYSAYGYKQYVPYAAFSREWFPREHGFFSPFASMGLGIYIDATGSGQIGWVPSIIAKGGIRLGGEGFGLELELASYLGIYNLAQLTSWVAWPLINGMVGIYVGI